MLLHVPIHVHFMEYGTIPKLYIDKYCINTLYVIHISLKLQKSTEL